MSARRSSERLAAPGSRAHGELRWMEARGGGAEVCGGVVVVDGSSTLAVPSQCGDRRLQRGEVHVAQHDVAGRALADRRCCVSCAVHAGALPASDILWSVDNWLRSAAARRFIETRYPTIPAARREEILQLTLDRAARSVSAGRPPIAVVPWCQQVIRHECASIFRSGVRRTQLEEDSLDDLMGDQVGDDPPTQDVGVVDDVYPVEMIEAVDVREAMIGRAMEPWQRSAALTLLSTRVDQAEPGERCPRPLAGAEPWRRFEWASLWYAGRRDAIGAGAATVQRRRRLMLQVREVLAAVHESLGGVFRA